MLMAKLLLVYVYTYYLGTYLRHNELHSWFKLIKSGSSAHEIRILWNLLRKHDSTIPIVWLQHDNTFTFLSWHMTSQRQWITKSMRETRLLYIAPSHSRILYILLAEDGYTCQIWSTGVYPPSHTASKCRRNKFIAFSGVLNSVCLNPISYFKFLPHRINTSITADTRVLMEGARIYEGENSQVIQSFLCHCAPKIGLC